MPTGMAELTVSSDHHARRTPERPSFFKTMPVACGDPVLTGDRIIAFTPAGTSVGSLDYTDFPTADPRQDPASRWSRFLGW